MLGNKTFDSRRNVGGEVALREGGIHHFVVALDFASMYPYVAESFNIDSSAMIPNEIVEKIRKEYRVQKIYDICFRERFVLNNGTVIESIKAKFTNNEQAIQFEVEQWNYLDKDDIPNLYMRRQSLLQRNPQKFAEIGLPKELKIENCDPFIDSDGVLHTRAFEDRFIPILQEFNSTTPKRKWNILVMIQNQISKEFWKEFIKKVDLRLRVKRSDVDYIVYRFIQYLLGIEPSLPVFYDSRDSNAVEIYPILLGLRGSFTKLIFWQEIEYEPDNGELEIFTKQSFRGDDRQILPDQHFALKELYNHVLRADRNEVKKQLKSAKTFSEKIRLNSLQNAIKTLMNSEYGASGASFFPLWNPFVPSMTTAMARASIGFLSAILENSRRIIVDEEFVDSNLESLQELESNNLLKIHKNFENIEGKGFELDRCKETRSLLQFNQVPNKSKRIMLEFEPAQVIYQDTDSNYYVIKNVFEKVFPNETELTPQRIKTIMHLMCLHNSIFIKFVDLMINRPPGGVNFEHAFIICRHFNAKKKYYGISYDESMNADLPKNFPNHLIKPGVSIFPNAKGEFFEVDKNKLLKERYDYLSFAKSQNIKVTGIDLARRDQYKFVNLAHLIVMQRDLRMIEFDGKHWRRVEKQDLSSLVKSILNEYDQMFNKLRKDPNIHIEYNVDDFVKIINNNPGKRNVNILGLRRRLSILKAQEFIPKDFEKVEILSLNIAKAKEICSFWKNKNDSNLEDFENLIKDICTNRDKNSERIFTRPEVESFMSQKFGKVNSNLIISFLDSEYYKKRLLKGLVNYLIEEVAFDDLKRINNLSISDSEKQNEVSRLKSRVLDSLVKEYQNENIAYIKLIVKSLKQKAQTKPKQFGNSTFGYLLAKFGSETPEQFEELLKNKLNEFESDERELRAVLDSMRMTIESGDEIDTNEVKACLWSFNKTLKELKDLKDLSMFFDIIPQNWNDIKNLSQEFKKQPKLIDSFYLFIGTCKLDYKRKKLDNNLTDDDYKNNIDQFFIEARNPDRILEDYAMFLSRS